MTLHAGHSIPVISDNDELKPGIHDEANGLDYVLAGDYYILAIKLPEDDDCPIRKWGWIQKAYLEETNPFLLNHLILTGRLHTYLADLNKQAQDRYRFIIDSGCLISCIFQKAMVSCAWGVML